ncbi:MAG TPA: adenylyltransferase/cytidyltransferase family protein [Chloroflexota bacterium]|nr:adenylyltransferase/cytidyltransferase family protein [Chloroflexota bacterium]
MTSRVMTREQAVRQCMRWRRAGQKVVLTNGCFDLLHLGHARYLQAARSFGRLVVGINSDASVRQLKGPDRPLVPEAERAELLAALRWVDLVTIFDESTAETLVEDLRPDVYVKGADYGPGARPLPESLVAERLGARVELVPLVEGHSTTTLIDLIRRRSP